MKVEIRMLFRYLKYINFKTLKFNLLNFNLKSAIRLPVFVSPNLKILSQKGTIKIVPPITTGMIKIGYGDITIFDKKGSRSIWSNTGKIIFKGKAFIGHGSKISCGKNGKITFGDNFKITAESTIVSNFDVHFGNNCLVSWNVLFLDDDFHIINNLNGNRINPPSPIKIGNHVWIGCRSLILKGSEIPDNTIVAAGSTISKKYMESNCIIGGVPASILKRDIEWIQ